jgi:hypothetical protein
LRFGSINLDQLAAVKPLHDEARVHQCRVVRLIHQALIARFVPHPEGIGEAIETRDLPRGFWKHAD